MSKKKQKIKTHNKHESLLALRESIVMDIEDIAKKYEGYPSSEEFKNISAAQLVDRILSACSDYKKILSSQKKFENVPDGEEDYHTTRQANRIHSCLSDTVDWIENITKISSEGIKQREKEREWEAENSYLIDFDPLIYKIYSPNILIRCFGFLFLIVSYLILFFISMLIVFLIIKKYIGIEQTKDLLLWLFQMIL